MILIEHKEGAPFLFKGQVFMHPRYAGIIQISLEGLFSAPPINGAPLENRLQR